MAHPNRFQRQPIAALKRRWAQLGKSLASEEFIRDIDNASLSEVQAKLSLVRDEMRVRWSQDDELMQFLVRRARADIESERIRRDKFDETRSELQQLRQRDDYKLAWEDPDPLVTVRIASYQNTAALMERAIASVLRQTHQNFEIIVVNDGPNPATRSALLELADPRIRYEEFAERSRYPEDAHLRWMVAGSPGMNRGAELACGQWIAPLDDDDEFTEDHIEKLIRLARETRAEFAYGAIDQHRTHKGERLRIFSDPPVAGQISMQAALYHSGLRFMRYDEESWRADEPGDWNLIRRMLEAGVKMVATEDYVTKVHMMHFSEKGSQ